MSKNYYVCAANGNELYHWKYIKRVRGANGKWRYYYDWDELKDDLGVDEREQYKNAQQQANQKKSEVATARAKYQAAVAATNKRPSESNRIKQKVETTTLRKAQNESYAARQKAETALRKYYDTPLGKLSKAATSGKNAIKKLFTKNTGNNWSGTDAAKRRTTNKNAGTMKTSTKKTSNPTATYKKAGYKSQSTTKSPAIKAGTTYVNELYKRYFG